VDPVIRILYVYELRSLPVYFISWCPALFVSWHSGVRVFVIGCGTLKALRNVCVACKCRKDGQSWEELVIRFVPCLNMKPSFVLIHIVAVVRVLQGTIRLHPCGLSGPLSGHCVAGKGGLSWCFTTVGSVTDCTNFAEHVFRVSYSNSSFAHVSCPLWVFRIYFTR
jgi:hypothetical protein